MSLKEWRKIDEICWNSYWISHPSVYYKNGKIRASFRIYGTEKTLNKLIPEVKEKMSKLGYKFLRSTKWKKTLLGDDVFQTVLYFEKDKNT